MKTNTGSVAQALYRRELKSSHYGEMFQHGIQGQSLKQKAEMLHFAVGRGTESQLRISLGTYTYRYHVDLLGSRSSENQSEIFMISSLLLSFFKSKNAQISPVTASFVRFRLL